VEENADVGRAHRVEESVQTETAPRSPRAGPSVALRTLVVAEQCPARNYLVELLAASGVAEVVGIVGTADEARRALRVDGAATGGVCIDAAFVDLAQGGTASETSGLHLVRSLAACPGAPMLVLATAHDKYALEAFDLGVTDYLLKPFDEERIARCLSRLQKRCAVGRRPNRPSRLVARRNRSLVFLEPYEIWAFEATDRLTFVHTTRGKFDLDLALTAIESSFGRAFMRVHRSWLVNVALIKEIDREGYETKLFVGVRVATGGLGVHVPVARERSAFVRSMLLANAVGLRRD
jgi:DNA-binding LytR/AlgR family response regulator